MLEKNIHTHTSVYCAWNSMAVMHTTAAPGRWLVMRIGLLSWSLILCSRRGLKINCLFSIKNWCLAGPGGGCIPLFTALGRQRQADLSSWPGKPALQSSRIPRATQKMLNENQCSDKLLFPKPHVPRKCPLNFAIGLRIPLSALSLKPPQGVHIPKECLP